MARIKPSQIQKFGWAITGSFTGSFIGNGSGLTNLPTSSIDTGSLVTTSSFNSFTSSYYTDSGSFSTRVTNLENFSSSLDITFVTEVELNAATASLSASIANLSSSFEVFSGSYNTGSFTGSFVGDGSGLTNLPIPNIDTGSLVTTASFNNFTSSINSFTASYNTGSFTGSFTGSLNGTSSWAENALTASYVELAQSASYVLQAESASYALTASYLEGYISPFPYTGSAEITGSLNVTGSTSLYNSGSTILSVNGPQGEIFSVSDDVTGDLLIIQSGSIDLFVVSSSGETTISGSLTVGGGITSSLYGTSSWAENALTASYVELAQSASYVLQAESASFSLTASYVELAQSASYVLQAVSSSFASTASYVTLAQTASYVLQAVSSSFASTASYVTLAQTASYVVTAQTASYVLNAISSSYALSSSRSVTASLALTASYITASNVIGTVSSASYAITASYVQNALSASYALNGGVTQLLAGPNVTLSPTNGLGQVTISSTGGGGSSFNTATGSYGSFYSTQTQTNVASTARSMSLNITDITNGVFISGSTNPYNTYIKTQNAGIYNIQFSAQVDKTDSGTDEIWIWIRKNGTNLTDTATSIQLVGNGAHYVAAWNFFVNAAADDYFQLMWYSPDANVRLHAEPAFGVVPGIPSLIVTANRIDQFLSNTGSFSGSFTGGFTGSLLGTATTASYVLNAVSSSFASTASYITASNVIGTVSSASYALTASYAMNGGGGGGTTFIRRSDYTSSLDVNINYLYLGEAPSGSSESSNVWDISRLSISSSGATLTQTTSSAAWTNRYTYTYL